MDVYSTASLTEVLHLVTFCEEYQPNERKSQNLSCFHFQHFDYI